MEMFELYVLFVLLPALHSFVVPATICLVLSLLTGVMACIIGMVENEPKASQFGKLLMKSISIPALIITMAASLAPTEKQVAVIVGGHLATNIEGVEKLPESMVRAVDGYLKQFEVPEESKEK